MRPLLPLLAAAWLSGCGSDKSDVSGGVDAINRALAAQGVQLTCPDEVDGGAGAEFECDLHGTRSNRTTKLRMRIVEQGDDLAVAPASPAALQNAVRQVAGG